MHNWYVVMHARKEELEKAADRAGMELFIPQQLTREVKDGKLVESSKQFYPGYAFLKTENQYAMFDLKGVRDVLKGSDSGEPSQIDDLIIHSIMMDEKEMHDTHIISSMAIERKQKRKAKQFSRGKQRKKSYRLRKVSAVHSERVA